MIGLVRVWNGVRDRIPPQVTRLLGVFCMVAALQLILFYSTFKANYWDFGATAGQYRDTEITMAENLGYFGLTTLGVGILIISGGIDLSIGSVVGLGAVCFGLILELPVGFWETVPLGLLAGADLGGICFVLARKRGAPLWLAALLSVAVAWDAAGGVIQTCFTLFWGQRVGPVAAALIVLLFSMHIGLAHGLLVTKLRLQPFLVTLCGLFIYRGFAKWLAPDHSPGWHVEGAKALRDQIRNFRELFVGTTFGPTEVLIVLLFSIHIGLAIGLLIPKLRLQPFLATLCGLFIFGLGAVCFGLLMMALPAGFRETVPLGLLAGVDLGGICFVLTRKGGVPLWLAALLSVALAFGVAGGVVLTCFTLFWWHRDGPPNQLPLMLIAAVLLGLFLHGTRHGRYLFAIGANEEAARYAGIATDRYKILAYVICSTLAGLSSLVFLFYYDSVQPTSGGSWLELYAITGAVLGGCSLRGGEGSILGLVLGAAVLPLLQQLCYSFNIKSELEYAVIGAALLMGTITDELLKRRPARRG